MSKAKTRRDIDKAVHRLMEYSGPNDHWDDRFEVLMEDRLSKLAGRLGIETGEVRQVFLSDETRHMTFGFLFEEYATTRGSEGEPSLIEAYIKQRGWREAPAGRQYLQALSQSTVKLWEIVGVDPGASVDVRPWGTQDKAIRVKEQRASESLKRWDGLAARVLVLNGSKMFSGAMLPFFPETARRMHRVFADLPQRVRADLPEVSQTRNLTATPDLADAVVNEIIDIQTPEIAYVMWGVDYYSRAFGLAPELQNGDGDPIEPMELHFPILSTPQDIASCLDEISVLVRGGDDCWLWETESKHEKESSRLLGIIKLNEKTLELKVDSYARSERGAALLQKALDQQLAKPLTIYTRDDQSVDEASTAEPPPEALEAMAAYSTEHYRKTLDEPIPMLDNKTPRECAHDHALRADVIAWLKFLENSDQRQTPALAYDFSWMWTELGLEGVRLQEVKGTL